MGTGTPDSQKPLRYQGLFLCLSCVVRTGRLQLFLQLRCEKIAYKGGGVLYGNSD